MGERLTEIFMLLFCEKNSDKTKNLLLKGKDMWQRIGKRLVAQDMTRVAHFLTIHWEVVHLDLCYNDIGDKGVMILVKNYLRTENSLEYLNLMSCSITWAGVKKLYSTAQNLKLKTLRINGNKLNAQGGQFAAKLLSECNMLTHLDLGDTDQTLESVICILESLKDNTLKTSSLQVLDISRLVPHNMMYQYDPSQLADNLGIMLSMNTKLVELHVQKCELDGHDVELLLVGLRRNQTLLSLDLGYNRIADFGIELIAKWLKSRPNLLGLNVAANGIGNTGARALSFGLPFSKVRLLDIGFNKITDKGMIDILNSIKKPYMLRLFYIWGNEFGERTNQILDRMFMSGVLNQNHIDIKLYKVDGILYTAFYPMDHYKQKYYCVMDYGCPVELKIKRNTVEHPHAQPRALVNFKFHARFPAVDESLPPLEPAC